MKTIEFETSKGRFLLIDSKDAPSSFNRYLRDIEKELNIQLITGYKLSEITEEEAREIVDEFLFNANDGTDYGDQEVYKNYITDEIYLTNPKESLHSLLESKGIHLYKNPYTNSTDLNSSFFSMQTDFNKEKEAEQKTFYNPYIFKL